MTLCCHYGKRGEVMAKKISDLHVGCVNYN